MTTAIKDKNIVLGVCGGIAAYKSVELLRLLRKQEANVRVIMTENAEEFVGPLTFEALSGEPVCSNLFEKNGDASIKHIDWAKASDAVIIAPATANIIGKLACGIADDALSTFMLAVTCPVGVCPSMNTHMWENRAVQRNLKTLRDDGYFVIEPGAGELACGTTGPGRLPEPEHIVDRLLKMLTLKDMVGKKVLVTAGPTWESIDPVRFITNPSSGKMGYAIARAAEHRGGDVTLISGPANISDPLNVNMVKITNAEEMAQAAFQQGENCHVIIKAAAVSDYRPKESEKHKVKKDNAKMTIDLSKTQDILKELGKRKENQILVGFAAETRDLEENAGKKLREKNLDMIVGNLVGDPSSGFGTDTNKVTLFFKDGKKESIPQMEKDEVAHLLLDRIVEQLT
ncbi:MAG: bifunctional phosphopantothenoylcysteine decarboxylase/phosphopantothenate--cysteine ligase CoaBC [Desulfobacterales bacterium]|nr:bifunctional phosphopantothenoylcysteine decarboxylase/phosphopantothenate--cysteine ligase CoaBC [Deltaproteobacteria bacterium]NNL42075.1 bifunctional phosphopantothenoylcysteine decarboxylase/phosphopantothenate--cysteine ligase CoaBC [Desulfobacterales bacterium]